jgi:hypothetical protein
MRAVRTVAAWPALPVVVAVLPFAVATLAVLPFARTHDVWGGDMAALELATRRALHGGQLLGPYSRLGWNHPGPAAFYWFAPFYALLGQRFGAVGVGTAVLNLACASGIVAIARHEAGRRGAWAAAAALSVLVLALGAEALRHPWNPVVAILPTALALVAAAGVAGGSVGLLPVLALASGFAAQTHVSNVLLVVGAWVVAAAGLVARRHALHGWRRPAAAAVLVTAIVWAPPVAEQLSHEPGDAGQLRLYARSNGNTQRWDAIDGQIVSLVSLTTPRLGLRHSAGVTSPLPRPDPVDIIVTVLLLAMATGNVVLRQGRPSASADRPRRFARTVGAVALVGVATSAVAARQVTGDFHLYLVLSTMAVGMALWLSAGLWLSAAVASPRIRRGGAAVAACVSLAGVGTVLARPWQALPDWPGNAIGPAAVAAAEERHARSVSVALSEQPDWDVATAVINELERAGIDVTTTDHMLVIVGDRYAMTGRETYSVIVAPPGGGDAGPPLPDDAVLIARWDGPNDVGDQRAVALYGTRSLEPARLGPGPPPTG